MEILSALILIVFLLSGSAYFISGTIQNLRGCRNVKSRF